MVPDLVGGLGTVRSLRAAWATWASLGWRDDSVVRSHPFSLLLFQRPQIQFPSSTWSLTAILTSVRGSYAASPLQAHYIHAYTHTCIHVCTRANIQIHKNKKEQPLPPLPRCPKMPTEPQPLTALANILLSIPEPSVSSIKPEDATHHLTGLSGGLAHGWIPEHMLILTPTGALPCPPRFLTPKAACSVVWVRAGCMGLGEVL